MKQTYARGLLAAIGMAVMLAGTLRAEEVIALFTFKDMGTRRDGTTLPDKELTVGASPALTLVEAGGTLVATNGQGGAAVNFTDAEGIRHTDTPNLSVPWTTGLRNPANAGLNYFELELCTLGLCDFSLRFDALSTKNQGPSSLTFSCAVGNGAYQTLGSLAITRDGAWYAYTNALVAAGLEHAERVRIRGTWSADAIGGSGRIDNLQITGAFTNGLTRVALYSFTGNHRTNSLPTAGFATDTLAGVNVSAFQYLTTASNTVSGIPVLAAAPVGDTLRDSYYRFTVSPTNRAALLPTHLRFYALAGGVSTGTVEVTMLAYGNEYSLGIAAVTPTVRPYTFHVPEVLREMTTAAMEYRIYFMIENKSSLRVDDVEVLGFAGVYPTNAVAACFPFTGNAVTNMAENTGINVSAITSSGTGALGFYTGEWFAGSESGVPSLSVSGFNGDAQNRYISFDLTSRWNARLTPTLISFYARTGSGTGRGKVSLVVDNTEHFLDAFSINGIVQHFYFSVPQRLISSVASGSAQVRVYCWNFGDASTTLRLDDWTVEGTVEVLPPKGTVFSIQ